MDRCTVCNVYGSIECDHDENTIFLMNIWLHYHPASLFEFYIRVYDQQRVNINKSVKDFIQKYNLYE